ncbi:MAG TPA: CpXC domain-containing protein [Roseiflexaceae bacterium]|nr:CpXC domain-containing protein [Roseiflexaceae bacterium]
MSVPPQVIQLNCPNCSAPVRAQLFTIVDAGAQPELKARLLTGQLNMAICPNCGNPIMLGAPLIYHDHDKQLCLVYFPQQLNARPEEQERFIGDATTMLMRTLPAEAPRGYLLAPKRFLTLNTLIDTVLEADGVSREMIDAQRRRVELISLLAEAAEQDDESLAALVEQHRAELNDEFIATLAAFVQASAQAGREESVVMLQSLLERLVDLLGIDLGDYNGDAAEDSDDDAALDEALTRLITSDDAELDQAIADLRPMIDYSFFAALTARIDAAEQAGDIPAAEQLTSRRARIVATVERMDREAQEMFEAGAKLLSEALEATDPREALSARHDQINDALLMVIDANINSANRAGRQDIVARLEAIRTMAIEIVEESLTPEERFINELLQAETPQAATRLLRQNPPQITAAFVKRLNEMADDLAASNQPLSERVRQLGREAGAMLF